MCVCVCVCVMLFSYVTTPMLQSLRFPSAMGPASEVSDAVLSTIEEHAATSPMRPSGLGSVGGDGGTDSPPGSQYGGGRPPRSALSTRSLLRASAGAEGAPPLPLDPSGAGPSRRASQLGERSRVRFAAKHPGDQLSNLFARNLALLDQATGQPESRESVETDVLLGGGGQSEGESHEERGSVRSSAGTSATLAAFGKRHSVR